MATVQGEKRQRTLAKLRGYLAGDTMSDTSTGKLEEILRRVERDEILAMLRRCGGERTKTARRLRISRSRLYRRLTALGIASHNAESAAPGIPSAASDAAPPAIPPNAPDAPPPVCATAPPETGAPLGESASSEVNLTEVLARVERAEIEAALRETLNQRAAAARKLGISRSSLYRRMDTLGIGADTPPVD